MRLIFFFALVYFISFAHTAPAGLESYLDRPDILAVKPRAHKDLAGVWNSLKWAHLEAVAQILEMYPEHEIYFLARDSELLYDFAKLGVSNDASELNRIHLLNISRANMRANHVKDYLEQEGISETNLLAGKKVLFVDTGFAGTISTVVSSYYSPAARANLKTHLLSSSNASHPSTRVFLGYLNSAIAEMAPSSLHGAIVSYEHLPRYTDRSNQFAQVDHRWVPVSPQVGQSDGSVDKGIALKYQEDLCHFWNEAETKVVFNNRRQLYRDLQTAIKDPANLEEKLRKFLKESSSSFDYVMLDLDDTLLKEISIEYKNHPGVQRIAYTPSPLAFEKYRKRLLEPVDPQKVIHYEIAGDRFESFVGVRTALADTLLKVAPLIKSGQKRIFITSANDSARTKAVWQQLQIGGRTLQELGFEFVSPEYFLTSQGQKDVSKLRAGLKLDPSKRLAAIDDLTENIIGRGNKDFVFQLPAFERGEVEALVKDSNGAAADQFYQKDRRLMANLESSVHNSTSSLLRAPDWFIKAIVRDVNEISGKNFSGVFLNLTQSLGVPGEKGSQVTNKLEIKSKYQQFADVLDNPDTQIPELFKQKDFTKIASILDLVQDAEITKIVLNYMKSAHQVAPEEASILELMIKAGNVNKDIAEYVLSKEHWKGHPELVSELIKAGNADAYIAKYVLSKEHWKDHPELVSQLIKSGKADMEIAFEVFTTPYWRFHPELVSELIKTGRADKFIATKVFDQYHWKPYPELLLELIKAGKADSEIALYALSGGGGLWKDHPEFVVELIKAGKADENIAQHVLTKSAWKNHPKLLGITSGKPVTVEHLRKGINQSIGMPKGKISCPGFYQ